MSEKPKDLATGGEKSPGSTTNGAAASAAAGKELPDSKGRDSQTAKPPANSVPEGSPPKSAAKRQATATSKTNVKAAVTGNSPGNGTKPAEGESGPGKDDSTIGLQFSSPSSEPPARRGLKPDPEKVRRARQESQPKKPEGAQGSRRAAATATASTTAAGDKKSDAPTSPDPEAPTGIPAAARLSGAIKPTRPTNQRLFRRHRRGVSVAISLLVVSGIVWWSGAFQKRTDLANTAGPAEIGEATPLETAAARPNDEELRDETRKLLSDLGLFKPSADGELDEDLKAAIRDYQAMADLPVNGEPSYDLLMDLRAVAGAIGTQ